MVCPFLLCRCCWRWRSKCTLSDSKGFFYLLLRGQGLVSYPLQTNSSVKIHSVSFLTTFWKTKLPFLKREHRNLLLIYHADIDNNTLLQYYAKPVLIISLLNCKSWGNNMLLWMCGVNSEPALNCDTISEMFHLLNHARPQLWYQNNAVIQ